MPLPRLEDFEPDLVVLSGFARALSHPARIAILQLLAGHGELAATAIVEELPLSQPACSRHLKELVGVGLLLARTDHHYVFYRLERQALNGFCRSMAQALHTDSKP